MIRYETGNWPSSRRCGYATQLYGSTCYIAGTAGNVDTTTAYHTLCSCRFPQNLVSDSCGRIAICSYAVEHAWTDAQLTWVRNQTCPKGWGRAKDAYPNDSYSVRHAQGYSRSGTSEPVYGYVTRYRDAYYNYITARVSKA